MLLRINLTSKFFYKSNHFQDYHLQVPTQRMNPLLNVSITFKQEK